MAYNEGEKERQREKERKKHRWRCRISLLFGGISAVIGREDLEQNYSGWTRKRQKFNAPLKCREKMPSGFRIYCVFPVSRKINCHIPRSCHWKEERGGFVGVLVLRLFWVDDFVSFYVFLSFLFPVVEREIFLILLKNYLV